MGVTDEKSERSGIEPSSSETDFFLACRAVVGGFLFLILTEGSGCVATPLDLDCIV